MLAAEEERCVRYGHPACVLSIDLDGLKQTNDRAGHEAGDRLLRSLATVLRSVTGAADLVARVGGDEFAVIALEHDPDAGYQLQSLLQDRLENESIRASLGLASRNPTRSLVEAWQAADRRMYHNKRRRKSLDVDMPELSLATQV